MRPINENTTLEQLLTLAEDYGLLVTRMHLDKDGYSVTLSEANGQTIATGLARTLWAAFEDAFSDVDELGKEPHLRKWAI